MSIMQSPLIKQDESTMPMGKDVFASPSQIAKAIQASGSQRSAMPCGKSILKPDIYKHRDEKPSPAPRESPNARQYIGEGIGPKT
jgi:hypothetical protein